MRTSTNDLAALDDALGVYAQWFQVTGVVETDPTSFQEQFRALSIVSYKSIWSNPESNEQEGEEAYSPTDMMLMCREVVELYGLLLILHRDTKKNYLYANRLLRLASCAREQITPRVRFVFRLTEWSDHSEDLDDWRVFLTSAQPRFEVFNEARKKILDLYEVEEAFVQDKLAFLTTAFDIQYIEDPATREAVFEVPRRVGELYGAMFPDRASVPMDHLMLHYDDVQVSSKSPKMMKQFIGVQWMNPSGPCKALTMEREWTRHDGHAISDAVNRDGIVKLELTVHSARELMIALEVYASLESTETVAITMEIGQDWGKPEWSVEDPPLKISLSPPRRLQLITTSGPDNMTRQVDAIMFVLNSVDYRVRDLIVQVPRIRLKTRVDERGGSDFRVIGELLKVLGPRVTSLEMDSCSLVEEFDHAVYAETPEDFDIQPILRLCPNLQLLAVQTATLKGLPELYERRETKLAALRVQWPPAASAIETMKTLGDPATRIGSYLVEFSTRRNDVELQEACLETLKTSDRLRYLRLGRGDPSDINQPSSVASQLVAHHGERLGLFSATLSILMNQVADTRALTTSARMDDAVIELIGKFVGEAVYRQVTLW